MSERSSPDLLDILLRNLGFLGDPFGSLDAGKEEGQDWFYECFVDPPRFSTILGNASQPQAIVIFAPRGSGKTALRAMAHYYCRRGYIPGGKVLSILHTDLSHIQEARLQGRQAWLSRYHVYAILRSGVNALAETASQDDTLFHLIRKELRPEVRELLRWYIWNFGEDIDHTLIPVFVSAGLLGEAEREIGFQSSEQPSYMVNVEALLEKGAESLFVRDSFRSYIQILRVFLLLLQEMDIRAAYVLVDGVDELAETTSDFAEAAHLLVPLICNLKVLDLPGIAFRFFLPAEMQPFLESPLDSLIRRDRVSQYTLEWDDNRLLELLHKRVQVFSRHRWESLDPLCAEPLRGRLEQEMVEACRGSPRTLLRLGHELLVQQAQMIGVDMGGEWLFREDAWERARQSVVGARCAAATIEVAAEEQFSPDSEETFRALIREQFPSPIALAYRQYLAQREPIARLQRLLNLFETVVAFCGAILISLYSSQLASLGGQARRSLPQWLGERCKRLTLGQWLEIIRRLVGAVNAVSPTVIVRRLQGLVSGETGDAVQRLHALRNWFAHHGQDPAQVQELIPSAEADLELVLRRLSFFGEGYLYKPINLECSEEHYCHRVLLLRGDNPLYLETDRALSKALECGKIWFEYKDFLLLLYPLLVADRCPECGYEEVFTYQRMEGGKAIYHNFASGHSLTSADHCAALHDLLGLS